MIVSSTIVSASCLTTTPHVRRRALRLSTLQTGGSGLLWLTPRCPPTRTQQLTRLRSHCSLDRKAFFPWKSWVVSYIRSARPRLPSLPLPIILPSLDHSNDARLHTDRWFRTWSMA